MFCAFSRKKFILRIFLPFTRGPEGGPKGGPEGGPEGVQEGSRRGPNGGPGWGSLRFVPTQGKLSQEKSSLRAMSI